MKKGFGEGGRGLHAGVSYPVREPTKVLYPKVLGRSRCIIQADIECRKDFLLPVIANMF